jgi:uncharacterized repeat protein (TIGR03943 family)
MTLDPRRALRALGLFAWAGMFLWLSLSGDQVRFIGPKTAWVVPFGAVALTVAALLYATTLASRGPAPRPSLGELLGTVLLVAPILLVFTVPDQSLGALAAKRKSTKNVRLAAPAKSSRLLDVYTIAYARQDPAFAKKIGAVPGARVSLEGLLSDRDPASAGFDLVRFRITCCAADATPYAVSVWPENLSIPDTGRDVQWLTVQGYLVKGPDGWLQVRATSITPADAPSNPYV